MLVGSLWQEQQNIMSKLDTIHYLWKGRRPIQGQYALLFTLSQNRQKKNLFNSNKGDRPHCCSSQNCQWDQWWRHSGGPPAARRQTISAAPVGWLWPTEIHGNASLTFTDKYRFSHLVQQRSVQEPTLAPGLPLSFRHPNSCGPNLNNSSTRQYIISSSSNEKFNTICPDKPPWGPGLTSELWGEQKGLEQRVEVAGPPLVLDAAQIGSPTKRRGFIDPLWNVPFVGSRVESFLLFFKKIPKHV